MTAPVTPVQAERQFVERMAETFTKQDEAPETPKDPTPPPAPAAKPSESEPEADTPDEEPAPPKSTPTDDDADDAADPGEEPPADDDEEKPDEEKEDEDEIDEEFAAAAKREKIALTVDDLPEEARPLVKKRIKELEAMATRATMDARAYRADEAKFRAEERFRTENPAEYVVDLLLSNPQLGEQVNALIDGLTSETTKQAHAIVVKDKRAQAMQATETALKAQETRVQRGLQLDSYTRTAAMKAGVPLELGVEASVIAFINEKGDISERDIDQIVAQKAKEYEAHTRAIRREASKKYVAGKVEARKTGGLKVKPGSGNAPAPSGQKKPKNDNEFIESFTGRM